MMPTANLRSGGSKLIRKVYLCILGYILLASRLPLLRLQRSPQQVLTSLGHGSQRLPTLRRFRMREEGAWLCDEFGAFSEPRDRLLHKTCINCPRLYRAPLTTHHSLHNHPPTIRINSSRSGLQPICKGSQGMIGIFVGFDAPTLMKCSGISTPVMLTYKTHQPLPSSPCPVQVNFLAPP